MKKENKMIERNIELSAEFSRFLFEHPEIENKLPSDAEVILLSLFDKEYNLKLLIANFKILLFCFVQIATAQDFVSLFEETAFIKKIDLGISGSIFLVSPNNKKPNSVGIYQT